ncbi:MAG: Wadjet anti-phage system protein JetD domain-containing protein, partial [Lysobacter sp.]
DSWLTRWRGETGFGSVEYVERSWPRLGAQRLPRRWLFASAQEVAAELGEAGRWQQACLRFQVLLARSVPNANELTGGAVEEATADSVARWPHTLSRSFDLLADLTEPDFARLVMALDWLLRHPDSGLYLRQVPIAGIDSKWMEPYRGVIGTWLAALSDAEPALGFHAASGLRPMPDRLRLRLLDPALRAMVGGLGDIAAPVDAVAALNLPVQRVMIVENLATGLAFDDLSGTVVFMARGYAVEPFADIAWLRDVPVFYWGDIDTHGLAILDRLRAYVPQVRSIMMDERTLRQFQELCVEEATPSQAVELTRLTAAESALYAALRSGSHGLRGRLEQERIAWDWAWRCINEALESLDIGSKRRSPPSNSFQGPYGDGSSPSRRSGEWVGKE